MCSTLSLEPDEDDEVEIDLLTTTAAPTYSRSYSPFSGQISSTTLSSNMWLKYDFMEEILLLCVGINFGATFAAPFNTFDPLDTSGWSNLDENPLIFSVMVSLLCFYLCCLIWARRQDLKDEVKVR